MCSFDCEACEHDSRLKEDLGCVTASQSVVWTDMQGEYFYNCPLAWITNDIVEWYKEYTYDTKIGSPLPYDKQCNKYVESWFFYTMQYNKYQSYMLEKSRSKNKGNDDLEAMAANLMAQKRGK